MDRSRLMRPARALGLAVAVGVAVTVLLVQPGRADAHGVGGVRPTNFDSRVTPGSPGIPDVEVAIVDLGERVQLTNRGSTEITVLGYQDEPYLRIGPDGVFENTNSPATFLNRTLVPTDTTPSRADPTAPPEWRRVSREPVARWHDHRAHWMGPTPKIVRNDPAVARQLTEWSIPLLVAGERGPEVTGTISWEPSTSPWLWILAALTVAAIIGMLSRFRVWRVTWLVTLVGIVVATTVIVTGAWQFSTYGWAKQFFANVYNLAAALLALTALWFAARRTRDQAAPIALIAGLVALFGTGLPGLADLSAPFVPTTHSIEVARAGVAAAIGLGLGLTIGAAQFLRISGTRTRPATTTPPPKPTPEEEPCPSEEVSPPLPSASPQS